MKGSTPQQGPLNYTAPSPIQILPLSKSNARVSAPRWTCGSKKHLSILPLNALRTWPPFASSVTDTMVRSGLLGHSEFTLPFRNIPFLDSAQQFHDGKMANFEPSSLLNPEKLPWFGLTGSLSLHQPAVGTCS